MYSLGDAARATGRSKPTIARAIKSGLISGSKSADGSYVIDPAELHRVFPLASAADRLMKQSEPGPPANPAVDHAAELAVLRHWLADREETIRDLRSRLDRATEQRDQEAEERRKLVAALTDGREHKSWFRRAFRRR